MKNLQEIFPCKKVPAKYSAPYKESLLTGQWRALPLFIFNYGITESKNKSP